MRGRWMIYGANGYTGTLAVAEAVGRGHRPVVAARRRETIEPLAAAHGLELRAFSLSVEDEVRRGLDGIDAVLHCAGPFEETSRPMVDACLATGTGYLDITGEIDVFESIFARDGEAKAAGVALVPGVGFDVVPTDCIAASLADALPDATELDLAISNRGGGLSRGTRRTMIRHMSASGAMRRGGEIVEVPLGRDVRDIPFASGARRAMTIPWGDVSTAFHSTGIPDIRVWLAASPRTIARARRFRWIAPFASIPPVRRLIESRVPRGGPDERTRETARVQLWGEARNATGTAVSMTAETPEGYAFTAVSAVRCVERLLEGEVPPGAHTPSRAFGPGLLASIEGVAVSPISR